MTTRDELQRALDNYFEPLAFSDYCPNGLQVEGKARIEKVGTAVSANLQTVQQAVKEGVDALIVHHGLFWNQDSYTVSGAKREKLALLLTHNISLFAYHLPLDAHREVGNNWVAARELGFQEIEPFGDLGVKGTFEPLSIDAFVAKLEAYYAHSANQALFGKQEVQSAALISGGAYRELGEAARQGVDCFITGNFDEPAWGMAYEEKMHFLALGHSATERVGPRALTDYLKKTLSLSATFIDIENPF